MTQQKGKRGRPKKAVAADYAIGESGGTKTSISIEGLIPISDEYKKSLKPQMKSYAQTSRNLPTVP